MDIDAVPERLLQGVDPGDRRDQPQLDLRIVHRQQHMARLGDEGVADLPPRFGAHGDVLQVGIVGRQPAGIGRGQAE